MSKMKQFFTTLVNKIKELTSTPPLGQVVPVSEKVEVLPEFPVKKAQSKKTVAKKPAVVAKKVATKKTVKKAK
jgi:hypothetical protein